MRQACSAVNSVWGPTAFKNVIHLNSYVRVYPIGIIVSSILIAATQWTTAAAVGAAGVGAAHTDMTPTTASGPGSFLEAGEGTALWRGGGRYKSYQR